MGETSRESPKEMQSWDDEGHDEGTVTRSGQERRGQNALDEVKWMVLGASWSTVHERRWGDSLMPWFLSWRINWGVRPESWEKTMNANSFIHPKEVIGIQDLQGRADLEKLQSYWSPAAQKGTAGHLASAAPDHWPGLPNLQTLLHPTQSSPLEPYPMLRFLVLISMQNYLCVPCSQSISPSYSGKGSNAGNL